ncbi:Ppx/GppA phosphatase [Sulfuricella denitrificans skB26]|uniref:Exopolyphosphatase n=1 Tax=Sulfuricella denitrificans (strain DSM 22764 / NBRC 105220 / skB26) TaxID=1163617 RepID=S6AB25_SULDS|nr:exopolyphosphatase [Sulfuricella denitrificans]BAN34238.1 Ppx/GppA phosphatase [Sulfuricella denitrificans skB26]
MRKYSTVAAVDLGSNSFRLQVARVVDDQIYPLDSLKDTVRLGAGLGVDKILDQETCNRALASLGRFGERLRGLPSDAVRAVGTNTFRVAKNAEEFLRQAEAALGFPIEIIAGREEARLIYLGVSHGLPASSDKRLVVDIGGGSTEFIIGTGLKPQQMESLYMGCVSYSQRYFPDGRISKSALRQADLAARAEVQAISGEFSANHWQQAIGSSGTAKALTEILQMNGYSDNGITPEGLARLRDAMLKAGDCNKLQLAGLRPDRVPVLGGGFAIMAAIFAELDIASMSVAETALREGVLYDLLGRFHRHDMRETTVRQFMRRYHVDPEQAGHVDQLGIDLLRQLTTTLPLDLEAALKRLSWAARLHEIGLSIAHSGFHKHSAYIIEHADMPGFSKKEQAQLSRLALAQRGSLNKAAQLLPDNETWAQILALRLAVLFYRSRMDFELPEIRLEWNGSSFELTMSKDWLTRNPLTEAALENEAREWKNVGVKLGISSTLP